MDDYEKLGLFYIGRQLQNSREDAPPLLYDARDLTTHAFCVGMTGSGKTGLGIALLEEAALDKIPAIIIDPKGDMGNLLLTFPALSPEEFAPWVDADSAAREDLTTQQYAAHVAKQWRDGLHRWHQDGNRIQKLRDSVAMTIYTPANDAGVPLSIMTSLEAPPPETVNDAGALRDLILHATNALLSLVGIAADPLASREHIFVSTLLERLWRAGKTADLVALVAMVQAPPFDKVGALDLDTFLPPRERTALAVRLNGLAASPSFQTWLTGEPLDIQKLLYTDQDQPKLSIVTLAHLSDGERQFFLTLLLGQLLAWMRRQPGTGSLRALLYMDEIVGFFPPTAQPPTKQPMLTLLKQARAYGLGVVLSTQNPVDLDYKGLANCGTWFIGKLQTKRDLHRVMEGLRAATHNQEDQDGLAALLAQTGKRRFLLHNVHAAQPILFETRWTLSYLRGPLTLKEIARLMPPHPSGPCSAAPTTRPSAAGADAFTSEAPPLPAAVRQYYRQATRTAGATRYLPYLYGRAKLHFVDRKLAVDTWETVHLAAPPPTANYQGVWDGAQPIPDEAVQQLTSSPVQDALYGALPAPWQRPKSYLDYAAALKNNLYERHTLPVYCCRPLDLFSRVGEDEASFRQRAALLWRERRDAQVDALHRQFQPKLDALQQKLRRADEKVDSHKQQSLLNKAETVISFGATLLGALFGRGVTRGTIEQTGTSLRRLSRSGRHSQQIAQSEEALKAIQQQIDELKRQLQSQIDLLPTLLDPQHIALDTTALRPRKSDLTIEEVALLWVDRPYSE